LPKGGLKGKEMRNASNGVTRRHVLAGGAAVAGAALGALDTQAANAAVPLQGASRPGFYRIKLGGFEVTTIWDGYVQLDGPFPVFGEDQPKEAVQQFASEHLLPDTRLEISFTPVVVNTGKEVVLFDTGNGQVRGPGMGRLAANLEAAGIKPEQVDIVVLTHFHIDHIGGLMQNGKPAFPNARYVAGETEYAAWIAPEMLSGPRSENAKLVLHNVVPLREKTTFIKPGSEVISGITALNVFGHTPGMLAFHIESEGKRLLIWADVTNHWVMSLERPDWHVSFDMDKEMAAQTRKRIFDMAAAERLPVQGYHMPFPCFGYVEKKDNGYRWVQATYQLVI
jgi:glyoxylase-like metal-dependent hydrolase (beta-lactamase superfamily II)